MNNISPNFSWVPTHKAIVEYLRRNRNRQDKLIALLRDAGINIMDDFGPRNKQISLEEIDPFTFFCYIYKHGPDRRLALLAHIAEAIDAPIPDDDSGIPSAKAQKVQLYPYKKDRVDEINRLWDFMESALKGTITDKQFDDILSIKSIGKVKITEILFYVDPEHYFPINGPAKPYLEEELGIDIAFTTYAEYKSIIDQIKVKTDEPFYALSYRAWKWNSERAERNYWVFQGNPKRFDLPKSVAEGSLNDWSVSSHKESIKPGDKVIIWMGGTESGIYALAEVTTRPYDRNVQPDEESWSGESKFSKAVGIRVTHDLTTQPILRTEVFNTPGLRQFNAGTQGTNLKATEEQYDTVRELISKRTMKRYWLYAPGEKANMWDEFYNDGVMRLGWPELGNLQRYKTKEEIQEALQRKHKSDSTMSNWALANFEFCRVMQPGDIVIAKKGKTEYVGYGIVTSEYRYEPSLEDYRSYRLVDWKANGLWEESEYSLVLKTLTDVTKNRDYVEKLKKLLVINEGQTPIPLGKKMQSSLTPLNTILYGPPGTGKTYSTIERALQCLGDDAAGSNDRPLQRERFDQYVQQGRIVFTTFHQSMNYEDFIEGIKPNADGSSGAVSYHVVDGIFKQCCARAAYQCHIEHIELTGEKKPYTFDELYEAFTDELQDQLDKGVFPLFKSKIGRDITVREIKLSGSITARAANSVAKTSAPLTKENIQKLYDRFHSIDEITHLDMVRETVEVTPRISEFYALFKGLKEFEQGFARDYDANAEDHVAKDLPIEQMCKNFNEGVYNKAVIEQGEDAPPVVIIIDEINRGNISQIFGELITLIETDKRLGSKEGTEVVLPYSKRRFGVPPNLYIIGTMNTADRSVEALDTALRRRFSFVEMPPRYELSELNRPEYGVNIAKLLKTINDRIEILLDRDHLIGHSYFMDKNVDLKEIFQNKLIPLLQEYFFGDYGKIGLVLGKGFVGMNELSNSRNIFAEFPYDDSDELAGRSVYHIKWPIKDKIGTKEEVEKENREFEEALKQLMKD